MRSVSLDQRNVLSLLAALFLLGVLTYELGQRRADLSAASSESPTLPDYRATSIESISTDERGHVIRQMTADNLDHYIHPVDHANLLHPRVIMLENDLPTWEIDALHGVSLDNNTHLILSEQVHGRRLTQDPRERMQIYTSLMHAYPDAQAVNTTVSVHIDSTQGITDAVGMDASLKSGLLNLHHNVRGNYVLQR